MGFWGSYYQESFIDSDSKERIEKQHINLSTYAMNVVEEDSIRFGVSSFSSFINRVFKNYYPDADASVIMHTEREKERLTQFFDNTEISEQDKDNFIKSYLADFQESMKKQIQSYPKGAGKKFRINNKNYKYLLLESHENEFYGEAKVGKYLKAVIEEYARKPYIERERIYFKDFIRVINNAIKNNWCLTIGSGKKSFKVSAFDVRQDPSQSYNYLIGKSVLIGSEANTMPEDCSFRISRIKNIILRDMERSLFSNSETKAQFQKAVEKKGVQFMRGDDSQKIVVEFTTNGISMYNSIQSLRPSYTERNGNIYKFDCTTTQAEFYFFKFGKEIKIINPPELADKFREMYHEAEKKYI